MLLNFIITAAEIIGGILSGSLALISDALHNFSDGISVIISYIAIRLTKKETTFKHTFGLKRAEILAAVINSSVLIVISVYLFYEAAKRFTDPSEINAELMIIVASIGLAANIIGTLLLYADSKHSMNIKSSYLHLLSDAVSSVAVILGGLAILYLDIYWIDPLLTILIGIYIIRESIHILGDAVHILMEGAPGNISIDEIQKVVESFDEVDDIHHVHMWMIGENDVHLEAHVNVSDMLISKSDDLRMRIEKSITEHFGITHITLQFESDQCKESDLIDRH
ncbi:MAG: cation diffusion facilitator family transporter [Melioribacteraceae bacterium]|nr:cation diffusion facilitator family transporter [Melioribacteraceae bacterium]MCF8354450.1 cation diffusion facilitator family transporter [Melioribacteraceae bacterium]MCF8394060.1 cation diffusion facilitator family transporter [Melioribacteraceae bacterium]MCF8419826.1 cation diffusion facilitator family transporter [Melioribacteraceae bacterium]